MRKMAFTLALALVGVGCAGKQKTDPEPVAKCHHAAADDHGNGGVSTLAPSMHALHSSKHMVRLRAVGTLYLQLVGKNIQQHF